jgi:pimeloyl-ACP methyl ester carboxylesterase
MKGRLNVIRIFFSKHSKTVFMPNKLNIVLVHGAWADASGWGRIIQILHKAGYQTAASQHPLTSLFDDVEVVRRVAEAQDGPTLLVGHSYGCAVITEAAHLCPNVVGLVYFSGFALEAGESLSILSGMGEAPPGAAAIRPDKYGMLWLDKEKFAENFCQDLDPEEALVMAITQKPLSVKAFEDKVTNAGWKNLPSWYQVSENDRMIPPPAEHFMAERTKAKEIISLPASHVGFIAHYKEAADFILKAAKALEKAPAEATV